MAGSTRTVTRDFDINQQNDAAIEGHGRVAFEEYNKVVTDLETLRAGVLAGPFLSAAPTVAIGTTSAAEVKITTAFVVNVNGIPVTVAAQEVGFTATSDDIADPDADPREALYMLTVDTQGNVALTRGADSAAGAAVYGDIPAGTVTFGQVLIQHNGTAVFNATTDDLDAAHLTSTFSDLGTVLPASGLTAATIATSF